jgi:TolB-like protein/DNA-binding winged helix-turn-helix (wHTH) protein
VPATQAEIVLLRFGAFEIDLRNAELRKAGVLVKLAPQPLQVLRRLAMNAGELQTRDEISRQIWGADTFVDFDRNLNVCMAQIRTALNDDADSPRFIQTVPKRGYRFIAPVEKIATVAPAEAGKPRKPRRFPLGLVLIAAAGLICAVLILFNPLKRDPSHRTMLAALPFETLSDDAKLRTFVGGLAEETIGQLSSLTPETLGVIARSSIMRYKGGRKPIDQIGRELGVEYVVEGTVRANGDGASTRVRIAARLIKVADQAQVWTETYEQDAADLFRMEQEYAARIATGIATQLFGRQVARENLQTRRREAWEAYRNGRYLQHKETRADLERSIGLFNEAAKFDPGFAGAYAALAEVHVMMARSGGAPAENFSQAKATAGRAIALEDSNAAAHNALANVNFWHGWNWQQAEQQFRRAIALNPSFAAAHHDYAWYLTARGRTEDGLSALRRAIALDPLSARINIDSGWLLLQAHRFSDAAVQARRALELEPGMGEAQACLSRSLEYQGNTKAALVELMRIVPASEFGTNVAALTPDAALQRFHLLRAQRTGGYMAAVEYAFLGDTPKALEQLERAYADRSMMMPLLKSDPAFERLHDQPRFRDLTRKVGIP